jgi:hypothetical protein
MQILDKFSNWLDKPFNFQFNVQVNHNKTIKIENHNLSPKGGFAVKTDFTDSHKLLRQKKNMTTLTQPSQVHEFIIYHLLTYYQIRGINFVVKDPVSILIEIQIQILWKHKVRDWLYSLIPFYYHKKNWNNVCRDLTKMVSEMMPVGFCNIKPLY